jgi:hypothetical protein
VRINNLLKTVRAAPNHPTFSGYATTLGVKMLKESNIEIYETLMVLPVYPGAEPSSTKPF